MAGKRRDRKSEIASFWKRNKEYSSNKYSDFERYSESEVYSCFLDKVFDWPYKIVSTRKQCVVWVGAVFIK